MKVPEGWAMPAAIVAAPWVHPESCNRYATLLDAVLNAGPMDRSASPWIILEDGRILTPAQISELRRAVRSGSAIAQPSL